MQRGGTPAGTPSRPLSVADSSRPSHHSNMTPAIRRLQLGYPLLFREPSRGAVFDQKLSPRIRLDWDRRTQEFTIVRQTQHGAGSGDAPASMCRILSTLSDEKSAQLSAALDTECRMNHFVYHRGFFAIDSVLKVFADFDLSTQDFVSLRSNALQYHNDFQSKFLWRGLYNWCRAFAADKPQAIELARGGLKTPSDKRAFVDLMVPFLTKPTYEACWVFAADVLPWESNFGASAEAAATTTSSGVSTRLYFLRTVFTTMTGVMFRLLDSEDQLNHRVPLGSVRRRDRNMRETVRRVYHDLAFNPNFRYVDRAIFDFEQRSSAKRRRLAAVDYILDEYLVDDGNGPPPPPPPGFLQRTAESPSFGAPQYCNVVRVCVLGRAYGSFVLWLMLLERT